MISLPDYPNMTLFAYGWHTECFFCSVLNVTVDLYSLVQYQLINEDTLQTLIMMTLSVISKDVHQNAARADSNVSRILNIKNINLICYYIDRYIYYKHKTVSSKTLFNI